jgi:hypothetical protein
MNADQIRSLSEAYASIYEEEEEKNPIVKKKIADKQKEIKKDIDDAERSDVVSNRKLVDHEKKSKAVEDAAAAGKDDNEIKIKLKDYEKSRRDVEHHKHKEALKAAKVHKNLPLRSKKYKESGSSPIDYTKDAYRDTKSSIGRKELAAREIGKSLSDRTPEEIRSIVKKRKKPFYESFDFREFAQFLSSL